MNKYKGWHWTCYDEGDHYQLVLLVEDVYNVRGGRVLSHSFFYTKEEYEQVYYEYWWVQRAVDIMESITLEEKIK